MALNNDDDDDDDDNNNNNNDNKMKTGVREIVWGLEGKVLAMHALSYCTVTQ